LVSEALASALPVVVVAAAAAAGGVSAAVVAAVVHVVGDGIEVRRWPLLSVEMIIEVRRSLEMMRWRRLSLMMVGGRGWSIVSSDLWHYRFVTPLHEDGDVPDIAGRFAGRLGTLLLLIVLWRDIDAGHESLTLTRLRGLLLLTLTLQLLLLLLPVLRRRRHRALTAFALLRAYLHVVAPLLLAYVHGVT